MKFIFFMIAGVLSLGIQERKCHREISKCNDKVLRQCFYSQDYIQCACRHQDELRDCVNDLDICRGITGVRWDLGIDC